MSDTDQREEDEVLRRMLSTPPMPHKPPKEAQLGKLKEKPKRG